MSEHFLDKEAVELLRRERCKQLTDDQFQEFLHAIDRHQLDPFANQIYAIPRGGRVTIQTGIDGFRLIADRTGKYAGNDDAMVDSTPGSPIPTKATITVYKMVGGNRCAFAATAYWNEYNPGGNMWTKMPCHMLSKCAESLALRKAFPAELSGLYTHEEMQQADTPNDTPPPAGKANGTPPKRGTWGSDGNAHGKQPQEPTTAADDVAQTRKAIADAKDDFPYLRTLIDYVDGELKAGTFNKDQGNELHGLLNQAFLPLMPGRIDKTPEENCDRLVAWIIDREFGDTDETRLLDRVRARRKELAVAPT